MRNWLKKIALTALLLILPLQGLATVLTSVFCHSGNRESVTAPQTQGHDHNAGMTHGSAPEQHENNGATGDYAGHLCCHHTVNGMPLIASLPINNEPSTYTSSPSASPPLFAPEQQLRPPRS